MGEPCDLPMARLQARRLDADGTPGGNTIRALAAEVSELREENARLVVQCELYRTAIAHPRQTIESGT